MEINGCQPKTPFSSSCCCITRPIGTIRGSLLCNKSRFRKAIRDVFCFVFWAFFFLALDKPSFNQDNTPGHRHVVHATMLHFYSGEKKIPTILARDSLLLNVSFKNNSKKIQNWSEKNKIVVWYILTIPLVARTRSKGVFPPAPLWKRAVFFYCTAH